MENSIDTIANHVTSVTVQKTIIKLINEVNDEVYTQTVNGKLNTTDSKKYAANVGYTFISKENVKETFDVPTSELTKLKDLQLV